MRHATTTWLLLGTGIFLLGGCDDSSPADLDATVRPRPGFAVAGPSAPSPLVAVSFGSSSMSIWPFTGSDFEHASDPMNLVFVGQADPRSLRSALMGLDGNRSAFGFPPVSPFDCTWSDAVGGVQTSYSASSWSASTVQLQCGEYGPIRFHLRLFRAGAWTLGNAHFEVLIPGTTDHEVLSWELAEQLVVVDFLRSGLLDAAVPLSTTGVINPAPSYRAIDPRVYNSLPTAFIGAIGGPQQPATPPIAIPSNGRATILNLARSRPIVADHAEKTFTIQYAQYIPKPFCSTGPLDWVRVDGPVEIRHTVTVTPAGAYEQQAQIHGRLQVTPVDILASPPVPVGATLGAEIHERYLTAMNDRDDRGSSLLQRILLPVGTAPGGRFQVALTVGPGGSSDYRVEESCGS
jgi:hypothetical protein